RPVLHFLQLNDVLLLLGGPCRLRFFELELAVVHDLDHGRARHRRHFHEIQPTVLRCRQRFVYGHHPQLLASGTNHPHRTDADLPVDADSLFALVCGQWPNLLPQNEKRDTRVPDVPALPPSAWWRCSRQRPWTRSHRATLRAQGGGSPFPACKARIVPPEAKGVNAPRPASLG